ncbi:uncharacterized protein LOC128960442 [Oppia nitens]|uniref:uncharacterized protein LOC128960442 n=1 Tax=Oppia nitens TaxID=1686743 RepID=UPI0023DC28C8|nr:uncharacterized protein LOC128960442 [Oppia nitens]
MNTYLILFLFGLSFSINTIISVSSINNSKLGLTELLCDMDMDDPEKFIHNSSSSSSATGTQPVLNRKCVRVDSTDGIGTIVFDPNTMPLKQWYEWLALVPENSSVLLTLTNFTIDIVDILYIHDGDSVANKTLLVTVGRILPTTVVSSGNRLFIRYCPQTVRSNPTNITFIPIKHGCGHTYTEPEGIIYSPGYPDGYYNGINCEWKITVSTSKYIVLMFDEFQTEPDNDMLRIGSYYRTLSGNDNPGNFISKYNYMDLIFTTNQAITGRGFKIRYTSVNWDKNTTYLISTANALIEYQSNINKTIAINGHNWLEVIGYDKRKNLVICYDRDLDKLLLKSVKTNLINNTVISGKTREIKLMGRPTSITYHWIYDLVYWIDLESKHIIALNITDTDNNNIYTIADLSDETPRDLQVNIVKSSLVWSNIGDNPCIMHCQLDGNNQSVLYRNQRQAFHLTVDYQTERYYFIDITDHTLYAINFDGNHEIRVLKSSEYFDSIRSMTVLNNDLYLSTDEMIYRMPHLDLAINRIQVLYKTYMFSIYQYSMQKAVTIDRKHIYGFKIVDNIDLQPPANNICYLHNCPHICLPSTGQSYSCIEPDSYLTKLPKPVQNLTKIINNFVYKYQSDKHSLINSIFISVLIVTNILFAIMFYRSKITGFYSRLTSTGRLSSAQVDRHVDFVNKLSDNNLLLNEDDNSDL